MYSSSHNTCIFVTNAFSPIMFDGALVRESSKAKMSQCVFVFCFLQSFLSSVQMGGWTDGRRDGWIEPKLMLTDKFRRC